MFSLPRDRMDQLVKRFDMLEAQMAAGPDPEAYVKMASEYAELEGMARKVRELRAFLADNLAGNSAELPMRMLLQGWAEEHGIPL